MEFIGDLRQMVGQDRLAKQAAYHATGKVQPALSLRMAGKVAYAPYPQQLLFHRCNNYAFETLYGGAAGGGKSYGMLWDAYMSCTEHPGTHVYMFRRTYPQLEKSLILLSRALFTSDMGRYLEKTRTWRIYTSGAPSFIHFAHCKHESDVYDYHSAQFDALYIDELTHFTEFQFTYLSTRVRPNVAGVKPYIKCSANPGGIGHGWVRRRWRLWDTSIQYRVYRPDREGDELVAPATRCFIPAKVTDNNFIVQNDPDYIERLKASPFRRQLLDGDWAVFSGQAFPEFTTAQHTMHSFPIPPDWERWISIDYGYTRPFSAHWHARDPKTGRVYTYRELYGAGIKEVDQARRTVSMSVYDGKPEKILSTIADPSVFAKRGGNSSIAEVWQSNGLYCERGNNERKNGKARVHSYLSKAPDGKPWWIIFRDRCPNLVRTLPELVLDEHDTEDVDTSQEDHAYDDCRYFLMHIRAPRMTASGGDNSILPDEASNREWAWYTKHVLQRSQLNNSRSAISEINDVRE